MLRKNNTRAWSALAGALLVLGLGLIAFATVGGDSDDADVASDDAHETLPAEHATRKLPKEWQWDEPVTL